MQKIIKLGRYIISLKAISKALHVIIMSVLMVYSASLFSQDLSIDGNRWYEVEISVFTNQTINGGNTEQNYPLKAQLGYPATILELASLAESLSIDFAEPEILEDDIDDIEVRLADVVEPQIYYIPPLEQELVEEPEPLVLEGPEYSPGTNDFRLTDITIDPFISLGENYYQFRGLNRDLTSSLKHKLLYHAVWRQPVLNKVQSTAVFIRGGEQFGEHSELEGSINVSFNVNRVVVDANLWRNIFTRERSSVLQDEVASFDVFRPAIEEVNPVIQDLIPENQVSNLSTLALSTEPEELETIEWQVPSPPFSLEQDVAIESIERDKIEIVPTFSTAGLETDNDAEFVFVLDDVAQLKEVRSMISNTLHYLDHPSFGLLVEVRPYQLPVPEGFE